MSDESTKDLIRREVENLIAETKKAVSDVKKFAVSEVWKILQLLTAVVIRLIENFGKDLSSPEKKELALELISSFYDKIFIHVDLPWVPSVLEPIIHSHVKSFLMILVSSGIDAMVATFRQVGVFQPKEKEVTQYTVAYSLNNFYLKYADYGYISKDNEWKATSNPVKKCNDNFPTAICLLMFLLLILYFVYR